MAPYFFRVEHDLLRSESFKALGGSAIKVYLTIGLYSDFGTDWAYPSIRTIAGQAGLSRQTVLAAIEELTRRGLLATSKSKGRSTAYKILRPAPERPPGPARREGSEKAEGRRVPESGPHCPNFFRGGRRNRSRFFRRRPSDRSGFFRGVGPIPRPRRPRGWAQTRTRNERRHEQHPDSGNAVPALGRRTASCCC